MVDSINVIIKTFKDEKEILMEYTYEGDLKIPVTSLLERINVKNNIKIHYSSSCLQGLCGSCSMLINGWPRLACKTFVNDLIKNKTNTIIIEPLSKFPIVNDLIIDRMTATDIVFHRRDKLARLFAKYSINEKLPDLDNSSS